MSAQNPAGQGIPEFSPVSTYATVSVTPTLDTSIYASGDSLSSADLDFTGAARANGNGGRIRKLTVIDKDAQAGALELWLFTAAVSPAAANAAHSITDGEAATCIGVIPLAAADYYASALNAVGQSIALNLPFRCASDSTTIYGVAVSRGAKTYTASGLVFNLLIEQD